jgi:hypothetical protein
MNWGGLTQVVGDCETRCLAVRRPFFRASAPRHDQPAALSSNCETTNRRQLADVLRGTGMLIHDPEAGSGKRPGCGRSLNNRLKRTGTKRGARVARRGAGRLRDR